MSKIEVIAVPVFVPKQSDLEKNSYVYSYTVKIENNSEKTIQLINRHWKIFSAGVQIADVKGEGVIGEKPVLKPGDNYEYSSWTVVRDPVGKMSGEYTFYTEDGKFLDVDIPSFSLIYFDDAVDETKMH